MCVGAAVGEGRGIKTRVGDEHTHLHVEVGEGLADGLLLLGCAIGHAVVFPSREPLVGSELDLIDDAVAGEVFKCSGVRGVTEIEFRRHGGGGLAEQAGLSRDRSGTGDGGGVNKRATIHEGIKSGVNER